jgi:hypothetical protein
METIKKIELKTILSTNKMIKYSTDIHAGRGKTQTTTIEGILELIQQFRIDNKYLYEVYGVNQPIKPFVDIDFKTESYDEILKQKEFIEDKSTIHHLLQLLFQTQFDFNDLIFLYSNEIIYKNGFYKYGCHILIDNHQTTSKNMHNFLEHFINDIKNNETKYSNILGNERYKFIYEEIIDDKKRKNKKSCIDSGVYVHNDNSTHKMRCPLVKKDKDQSNFYLTEFDLCEKHIIQYVEDNFKVLTCEELQKEKISNPKSKMICKKENKEYKLIDCNIPEHVIETLLDLTYPPKNYTHWRDCIWSLESCGVPFELINDWSKKDEINFNYQLGKTIYDAYIDGYWSIGTFLYLVVKQSNVDLFNEILEQYNNFEYTNMKKWFEEEEQYCKILKLGCYYNFIDQKLYSEKEMSKMWRHKSIKIGKLKKRFVEEWMNDENIRIYDDIQFIPPPKICPDNVINTWQPVMIEEQEETEHNYTKLLYYICNQDQEVFDYVMKWIYHLINFPAIKPNTSLVFKSIEGAGKNLFFQLFLEKIIGSQYISCTENPEHIFNKFSTFRENKLLLIFDESKALYKHIDIIKGWITNPICILEQKGIQARQVESFDRLIFNSNNDYPVFISDTDRRFMLVEITKNDYITDGTFDFKYLNNDGLNNPKEIQGFLEDLQKYEVSQDYDFKNTRPITDAYKEIQEVQNYNPVIEWWDWILYMRTIEIKYKLKYPTIKETEEDFKKGFTMFECYEDFQVYMNNRGFDKIKSRKQFEYDFNRKLKGIENKRVRFNNTDNKITRYLINE